MWKDISFVVPSNVGLGVGREFEEFFFVRYDEHLYRVLYVLYWVLLYEYDFQW